MAVPVWTTGQVLTSSDVNTWFVPLIAYKTSDTTRSNTTTVSNDPDLTVPVAANAFYQFEAHLNFEGSGTASQGIKWTWNVPASSTLRYYGVFSNAAGGQDVGHTFTGASINTGGTDGAGNLHGVFMNGTLFVQGTAGNITLQWSQNVAEASVVNLHSQSHLMLRRIG